MSGERERCERHEGRSSLVHVNLIVVNNLKTYISPSSYKLLVFEWFLYTNITTFAELCSLTGKVTVIYYEYVVFATLSPLNKCNNNWTYGVGDV